MQASGPAGEQIRRNLEAAIHRLNDDFDKVEFWAAAMDAFLKPVPNYDTAECEFLLRRKD